METARVGLQLMAASWPDPAAADRFLQELRWSADPAGIDRVNVAPVVLGNDGRLRIGHNDPAGPATIISGVVGAALGLLTGGPDWIVLGGGILQHLAAAAAAAGLATQPLRDLGESMTPGCSAVIVVAPVRAIDGLRGDLSMLTAWETVQHLDATVVEVTGLTAAIRYDAGEVDGDVIAARTGVATGLDGNGGSLYLREIRGRHQLGRRHDSGPAANSTPTQPSPRCD